LSVIGNIIADTGTDDFRQLAGLDTFWIRNFIQVNAKTGTIYSKTYQMLRMAALNLFWIWMVEQGLVPHNPLISLWEDRHRERIGPRPSGGNNKQRLPAVLMWDDLKKLMAHLTASESRSRIRDHAMISLILATGLRCEELCKTRLVQLDLAWHRMRIVGKGNKERIIEFGHDNLVTDIVQNWLVQRDILLKKRGVDSPYLFITGAGKPLSESLVYQQVSHHIKAAGLEDKVLRKGPHLLRHTAASIMFARQVPVLRIQQNLGHGDLMTTQIYAHLLPSENRHGI
jgi:site-specific recombinase XerD